MNLQDIAWGVRWIVVLFFIAITGALLSEGFSYQVSTGAASAYCLLCVFLLFLARMKGRL